MKRMVMHEHRSRWCISRAVLFAAILPGIIAAAGCEPYRIMYVERPEFYQQASETPLPDRVVLDDGTVIVYRTRDIRGNILKNKSESESFQIREELDNGDIVLRALMPEHVLANTVTCLSNEEYDLMWEQLLSMHTKLEYETMGQGREDFIEMMKAQRVDLLRTVTRMLLGMPRQETVVEHVGQGVIEIRFRPHVARAFKYTRVRVISEGLGLKLLIIR